jgi:hypothetical protein
LVDVFVHGALRLAPVTEGVDRMMRVPYMQSNLHECSAPVG